MSDVPFQYKEREAKYTEVVGNPTDIIFVANKRDHKFSLGQKSTTSTMSQLE